MKPENTSHVLAHCSGITGKDWDSFSLPCSYQSFGFLEKNCDSPPFWDGEGTCASSLLLSLHLIPFMLIPRTHIHTQMWSSQFSLVERENIPKWKVFHLGGMGWIIPVWHIRSWWLKNAEDSSISEFSCLNLSPCCLGQDLWMFWKTTCQSGIICTSVWAEFILSAALCLILCTEVTSLT